MRLEIPQKNRTFANSFRHNMKRIFVLFFISVIALPGIFAQGFSLTVNCQGIKADSIHLQQFDGKKDFSNVLSVVFAEKATLKQKAALPAGYYSVAADTNYLFTLLISEEKKQSITANVNAGMTVEFTGSDENQAAWNYRTEPERLHRDRRGDGLRVQGERGMGREQRGAAKIKGYTPTTTNSMTV